MGILGTYCLVVNKENKCNRKRLALCLGRFKAISTSFRFYFVFSIYHSRGMMHRVENSEAEIRRAWKGFCS